RGTDPLPAAPGRRADPDAPGGHPGLGRPAARAGAPSPARARGPIPPHPRARFATPAAETLGASAVRRAAVTGEETPVARVVDLPAVVPVSLGKVEFDQLEEGRELELLKHLLRRSVAETWRARLAGSDLSGLLRRFDEGATVETGDLVPA